MAEFREIPEDAHAPRYMTGPHPRAVGTLGPEFVEWADRQPGLHPRRTTGLRWWQKMTAYRLLEVDEDGELVWRNVLLTMARQVGKSWLIRAIILWRIQQGERWSEDQAIMHCAHRMATAIEVWRPGQRWALEQGWHVRVTNGEQMVEEPGGGRWLVRAATDGLAVGFALSCLVVDEAWQIARSTVEAADPALTESVSPQLWLVSTAGDAASDLFASYRDKALGELEAPGNTLIVEWSAPKAMAIDDPAAWRMASPHWSDKREAEVIDKLGKMERLEFVQQYLCQWIDLARNRKEDPSTAVLVEDEWEALNGYVPAPGAPLVAAVESYFGEGCSVALSAPLSDGRVGVSVSTHPDLSAAARVVAAAHVGTILVGKSLAPDPAFAAMTVKPMMARSSWVATTLRRLVNEGAITHNGNPDLTEQALSIRTVPGTDGPRVVSKGRSDGVKALLWSVEEARKLPPPPLVF
jgi:phage terminase large subunit-like protein